MDDTDASMEPRHAEFELKHDQERGASASASWNAESDTDSDDTGSHEYGRGNGGPLSASKIGESDAESNEDNRELSAASKKESEKDMVSSSGSSSGDVEIEQEQVYNSSRDLPTGALDTQTFSEEEEKDEGTNTQETQNSPEFQAFTAEPSLPQNSPEFEAFTAEPSLPIDEVVEGSSESASDTSNDSNKQSLGGNTQVPISTPEVINMQETQSRPEPPAAENHERSLPLDEVGNGSMKFATETAGDSATHALGDNAEELPSQSEGTNEGAGIVESQRPKAPIDQENEPSSSQSRDIAPKTEELEEHSDHDPLETRDEYLKKGFTCGGNPEEADEEQLREHWMRTLQTSTSTGEIVEEIVKVLKHHQKTHDLLCPVCGSCVTRRVVLRKRKRSSLISVDRWYRDPLDEAETQELGSTFESTEAVEERATEEYQDTEAYGCLSCFSLFFEKGRQLFSRLHADAGSERFNCLPFFFPPYPWGMTQMRPRSPGMDEQVPREEVIEESEEPSNTIEGSVFSCGIGPALLPDYPWGTMPLSKGEHIQGSPTSETVEEQQPQVKESTCTCGLAQALIPEYSWGYLSKPEEAAPQSPRDMEAVAQPEISEEVPELPRERRDCTCGLVPALLPNYPWGFFKKDEGAHSIQTQTEEEIEGKEAEDIRSSCDVAAAVLPSYPWGMMTESPDAPEDGPTRKSRLESLQSVGSAILPLYPWGVCSQEQTVQAGDEKDEARVEQVTTNYIEQETTIEARITSKTDVYTVTSSKTTYPGEKPPQNIKNLIPNETSQTIKHVKLDQTVTIIDASVTVDEGSAIKGPPLESLPSTGYALLDMVDEGLEKGRLESKSSTGYAHLEEISEEAELTGKDTPEQPHGKQTKGSKVVFSPTEDELGGYKQELEIKEEIIAQSIQGGTMHKPEKPKPNLQSQFPSFQWSVEKLDAGDLKSPFLKGSGEPEAETVISVLKPTPDVEKPKGQPWLSIFKLSKPSDEEGITTPLLSATGYIEEIEEVKLPAGQTQTVIATEAVIDVPPADLGGTTVGTGTSTAAAVAAIPKKETDGWDILKSIVYGGLDISIASLGVTSSAAGGNAITRTVVYMGLATLLSGLIGFYHNVLNLYHHHREHYYNVVGVTLLLHGTVALVSFVFFGLLSPLLYAFSYRKTDNRDDKFILCCGVTIVAVLLLSLGKAKVSNKRYIRTVCAYLLGGVLAVIIGYLTGEHVEELLEEWGL